MAPIRTTIDHAEAPGRVYETAYTAIVFENGSPVLDESYANQSARRDAVVQTLLINHDEVPSDEVTANLAPFGGANADVALGQVIALYAGYGVDVHLGEHRRDVGPAVLYSVFTDYGDGTTFAEHYGSKDERLAALRQRAADLGGDDQGGRFDAVDEAACKTTIKDYISPTNGRLHLFDARREAVGGTYCSLNTPTPSTEA